MLSEVGLYLTAYYGRWPVTAQATANNAQGVAVTVERDRTLQLGRSGRDGAIAGEFLRRFPTAPRAWYLGSHPETDRVVAAMADAGYTVETVAERASYRLFRGTR